LIVDAGLDEMKEEYRRINLVFNNTVPPPSFALAGVERVAVEGRTVSLLASRNVDRIVNYAQVFRASSVEVLPVTLKEIFLESLKTRA